MDPAGPNHLHRHPPATQGTHQIVLEYFEANGGAVAKFAYSKTSEPPEPPPPVEPFAAEYFDNSTLNGGPVLTRTDDAIDFDWGEGAPSSVVASDRFSARWTRTKSYEAGTYRLTVTGDDGIRVLVDGGRSSTAGSISRHQLLRGGPIVRGPAHRGRGVLRTHRRRGREVQRVESAIAPRGKDLRGLRN